MTTPSTPFLDTNIFLRHLTGEPEEQSKKSTALFQKIENNEIKCITNDIVIFETVFTLLRSYKLTKQQIRNALLPILELPSIQLKGKTHLRETFDLFINKNLPFADAYFVIFMETQKIKEIISYDREFDKIKTITRKEP